MPLQQGLAAQADRYKQQFERVILAIGWWR
jgi:hypothetical protein